MSIHRLSLLAAVVSLMTLAACETAPPTTEGKAELQMSVERTLTMAKANDPSLAPYLRAAAGYAVFPDIGKGAIGVGGAYGKGVLYEEGVITGYCDLKQATIGAQLGGQAYTEIICFETRLAVNRFKQSDYSFDAQATAVALKSGAGTNAKYANGVSVFTMNESGLMYEASVGGQKFNFQPK
jgi:lipid-binding SYLF domain-containing protein